MASVFWGSGHPADEVADFDEYDPTPYGGGYDIALTFGRALPPSDEICPPALRRDMPPHLHRLLLLLLVRPPPARPEATCRGDPPLGWPRQEAGRRRGDARRRVQEAQAGVRGRRAAAAAHLRRRPQEACELIPRARPVSFTGLIWVLVYSGLPGLLNFASVLHLGR